MNYSTAMHTPNSPELQRIGTKRLARFKQGRPSANYWNAGVDAYAKQPGMARARRPVSISNFYHAGIQTAYGDLKGAQQGLGDLFNDIMGTVVPGWANRSPELKKIQVKVDPAKVMQQAQKLLSPDQARRAAEVANEYGVTGTYRGLDMTPGRIAAAYQAGGIGAAISEVPMLYWIAGAGGLGVLYYFMKR